MPCWKAVLHYVLVPPSLSTCRWTRLSHTFPFPVPLSVSMCHSIRFSPVWFHWHDGQVEDCESTFPIQIFLCPISTFICLCQCLQPSVCHLLSLSSLSLSSVTTAAGENCFFSSLWMNLLDHDSNSEWATNQKQFIFQCAQGPDTKENKSSSTEMGVKASSAAEFTAKVPQMWFVIICLWGL